MGKGFVVLAGLVVPSTYLACSTTSDGVPDGSTDASTRDAADAEPHFT